MSVRWPVLGMVSRIHDSGVAGGEVRSARRGLTRDDHGRSGVLKRQVFVLVRQLRHSLFSDGKACGLVGYCRTWCPGWLPEEPSPFPALWRGACHSGHWSNRAGFVPDFFRKTIFTRAFASKHWYIDSALPGWLRKGVRLGTGSGWSRFFRAVRATVFKALTIVQKAYARRFMWSWAGLSSGLSRSAVA